MTFTLDRRRFLQLLASVAFLPKGLEALSPEEIEPTEEVWRELEREPLWLDVQSSGAIWLGGGEEPKTRFECYDLSAKEVRTAKELWEAAERNQPVMDQIEWQWNDYAEEASDRAVQYECAEDWCLSRRGRHFSDLRKHMLQWLADEPDWLSEGDYIFQYATGQEAALRMFRDEIDANVVELLGVVIVEGEFPGSSYYAAELRMGIEEANAIANTHGIPLRFREGSY